VGLVLLDDVETELFEVFRDAVDGPRLGLFDEARDTGLMLARLFVLRASLAGREVFEAVGSVRGASPALSTNVFLLGTASGTRWVSDGASVLCARLVLHVGVLCLSLGGGIMARALLSEIVSSDSPTLAGIRLGGRIPVPRTAFVCESQ